jgi:hypothetical protein
MTPLASISAAALAAAIVVPAAGESIPLQNPGFEFPPLPTGAFGALPTGWTNPGGGGGGVWQVLPQWAQAYSELGCYQGLQVGFTNGGPLVQGVSEPVTEFTRYVVTASVGNRMDCCTDGTYRVQLFAGGVMLAEDNSSLAIPAGQWLTSTVVYDALPGDPNLGQVLEIRLARGTFAQANFDRMRLDKFDIDCNDNGIVDSIDIKDGFLGDADGDGIADGCEDIDAGTPADFDDDGVIGGSDLGTLLLGWGKPATECPTDLNGDNVTDGADLGLLLLAWTE